MESGFPKHLSENSPFIALFTAFHHSVYGFELKLALCVFGRKQTKCPCGLTGAERRAQGLVTDLEVGYQHPS